MSGGVDSSATAALLLEQGFDVVGVTLKLWPQDCVSRAEDKCCGPQAVMDARKATVPARRFGTPDEFGATCAFLCSQHAGYITGQNVLIDGGAYPGTY